MNQLVNSFLLRVPAPSQNFTYIFIPQNLIRSLFGGYGRDLPASLAEPDFSDLDANDVTPSNIDPSTISYAGEFLPAPLALLVSHPRTTVKFPDNGVAFVAFVIDEPEHFPPDDRGWTVVETNVIRLNASLAPSGRFPVYSNTSLPGANGTETRIGYDAAACVYRYEPWVVETYNTSIVSPSSMRIVEKADGSTSMSPSGKIRGTPIANTRYLNTTNKTSSFYLGYYNGINVLRKDNDRTANYVPSPSVGPVVLPPTTSLLISTLSTDRFFHRWQWTSGVHRTLPRPARCCPRTNRRSQRSTIPCGVSTHRRTSIRG